MADISNPTDTPTPPPRAELPPCALFMMCVECGQGIEVPLPLEQEAFAIVLAQQAWFVTVLAPTEGQPETLPVLAALCTTCAPTIFQPEVMRAAEERRQALLRSIQLRSQQGTR